MFHRLKLLRRQHRPFCRTQRIQTRLDKSHRRKHPQQRTDRIKRLCQIQTARRGRLIPHRKNIRIGTGLQKRQTAGQDEISHQKWIIHARHTRRNKQQRPSRIQSQSNQYARLIGILADKQRSRKSHRKIAPVKSELHQSPIHHAHSENLGKSLHHRIGNVISKSPGKKQCCHQNKRQQQVTRHQM